MRDEQPSAGTREAGKVIESFSGPVKRPKTNNIYICSFHYSTLIQITKVEPKVDLAVFRKTPPPFPNLKLIKL